MSNGINGQINGVFLAVDPRRLMSTKPTNGKKPLPGNQKVTKQKPPKKNK